MTTTKQRRGFATLTPERRKEIASMGGKAAHAGGNAHQFDSAEGAAAGRKRHENATARASAAIATQFGGTPAPRGRSAWPGSVDSADGGAY